MIQLTKEEAQAAWVAINLSTQKNQQGGFNPRNFPLAQLKDAAHVGKELKDKCVDIETDQFKDGEVDFKTDHKKLVLGCLDREWPATNGEAVLTLKEKLEA